MSNQEFENYLVLVGKLLRLSPDQRDQIGGELRDHLELRVDDLINGGATHHEATARALEEFGDAAAMARNFQSVNNHRKRRWMMRFATLSTAGLFLAAILMMAMWPNDARFGAPGNSHAQSPQESDDVEASPTTSQQIEMSDSSRLTRRAELALKEPCDLNYDEETFSDIMADLARKTNLNFILTDSAIDDLLTMDELISFQLKGIPLEKSLNHLLKSHNATYCIDCGVVLIISLDDADHREFMRTKMFDCKDLVEVLPKRKLQNIESSERTNPMPGKTSDADEVDPVKSSSRQPDLVSDLLADNDGSRTGHATLLNLVYAMVDSDSWTECGTGLGKADVVNGVLVVHQSQSTLLKIDDLLEDLRSQLLRSN